VSTTQKEPLGDVTFEDTSDTDLEGSNLRAVPPEGEEPADQEASSEAEAAPTSRAAAQQPAKLSKPGAAFISRFEGFRARLYNDPVGHCTIGIGHLVHHGNCNGSEPAEFKQGITQQRAFDLLLRDCAPVANAIHRHIRVALNQAQFDALVSWGMNNGADVLRTSTLTRLLNQGDYGSVPAQLLRWNKAGNPPRPLEGLTRRRKAEGKLFARGQYQ
jgi:GH24 family phage-related lysozyme (muramidase)